MKIFSLAIECFLIISTLHSSSSAAPTLQLQQHQDPLSPVKRSQDDRNALFIAYTCQIRTTINIVRNKLAVSSNYVECTFMYIFVLQSMLVEQCTRGPLFTLPDGLLTRYQQLDAPQCTNITHINAFLFKLVFRTNDLQIRDILYHMQLATANLNHIHVS